MIKPEELRIGNYIMDFYKSIHRIEVIERKFLISKPGIAERYEDINPIPLTEDWLLKFGFERISSNVPNLFRRELDSQRNMRFDSEDGFRIETKGSGWGWVMPEIKCVHQLQNIYYALRGEELTVNDFPKPKP